MNGNTELTLVINIAKSKHKQHTTLSLSHGFDGLTNVFHKLLDFYCKLPFQTHNHTHPNY